MLTQIDQTKPLKAQHMRLAAQTSRPYAHSNIPAAGQLVGAQKECDDCWDVALNEPIAATERFVASVVLKLNTPGKQEKKKVARVFLCKVFIS